MISPSRKLTGIVLGLAALDACQSKDAVKARTDTGQAMAATPAMAGAAPNGGMMDSMETHMRAMTAADADQLKAMLPEHRQLVANMLSQMNQEMHSMNMPASAAWTATIDSVRLDLIHLPDMTAGELKATMPAHRGRVTRLLQMHRDMMGNTKP